MSVIDSIKLDRWIHCIGREVGMRTHLYPKAVKDGQMKPEDAAREKQTMEEIYEYFKSKREAQNG